MFSLLLVVAISRLNGPDALGKYSILLAVFVFGQNVASLGLPVLITREIAKVPRAAGEYYLGACVVSLGVVASLLLILFPVLSWLIDDAELQVGLLLVLLSLLPSVPIVQAEAVLLGLERSQEFVLVGLGEIVLRVGLSTVLVLTGYGIVAIALTILGARLLSACVLPIMLRARGVKLAARVNRKLCRGLISQIPVLGAIPLVNALYSRADLFLLSFFQGLSETGLYSASARFVDMARVVPLGYSKALYPLVSKIHGQTPEDLTRTFREAHRTLLLIIFPLAVVLSGLADYLITWLYGPAFSGAITVLRVLAWTLIPYSLACILAQILFALDRQADDLRVNIIATLSSIGLNLVMIPRWGANGAAFVCLFSMTIYAALQYYYVAKHVISPSVLRVLGKICVCGGVSWAMITMLLRLGWNPFAVGLMGLSIYVFALFISATVTRADISTIWTSMGFFSSRRDQRAF